MAELHAARNQERAEAWLRLAGVADSLSEAITEAQILGALCESVVEHTCHATTVTQATPSTFEAKHRYALFWAEIKRTLKRIQFFEQGRQVTPETSVEAVKEGQDLLSKLMELAEEAAWQRSSLLR